MRNDLQVDDQGKLIVKNGDFVVGESDRQHVEHIVIAHPGEFKMSPMLGFAAISKIKSNTSEMQFKRDLKIQLTYDGYQDPTIDLSKGFENLEIKI